MQNPLSSFSLLEDPCSLYDSSKDSVSVFLDFFYFSSTFSCCCSANHTSLLLNLLLHKYNDGGGGSY